MPPLHIKISHIDGLREVVLGETSAHPELKLVHESREDLYFEFVDNFKILEDLKSALRVYIVAQDDRLNPYYVSRHKSVLGNLIDLVLGGGEEKFRTFKVVCAGSDSKEVREIASYVRDTYKLEPSEDADLKIHMIKIEDVWELGVQITRRPLAVRDYKVENLKGAINPTIAYAMNALANLGSASSYLNVFSGSATLLIEAARLKPDLKLVGFDANKETVSAAIQNVKKAGLIKTIQLKALDIFEKPDLGTFDVIASDLPFGMLVSKDDDLEKLYRTFVEYCEGALNPAGRLIVYTSEHETFKKALSGSKFKVAKTIDLRFLTSVNAYLYPKIFVCEFR